MQEGISVKEVTPSNFCDLETLFGPSGAYYGCWCMYRRLTLKQFEGSTPDERKGMMESIINSGEVPGLLLYESGTPAGWVSVAPVEQFKGLMSPRFRKQKEKSGLWTISCFFVEKKHRGKGYMSRLLEEAVDYAREKGGRGVIASPTSVHERTDTALLYTGKVSTFQKLGFEEIKSTRNKKKRRVMILNLKKK